MKCPFCDCELEPSRVKPGMRCTNRECWIPQLVMPQVWWLMVSAWKADSKDWREFREIAFKAKVMEGVYTNNKAGRRLFYENLEGIIKGARKELEEIENG